MEIFIKVLQLILSLSILVVFHEMGHFMFAKLFKTRVEKFYLFFDPWFSLFKIKKGETEYGIGWLPLGGYVKISGMIDESMDKEQMKLPPQSYEFRSKPAWQRLLIMLGGVTVNFILAFVIYSAVLYVWGEQYLPTKNAKYGIMVDSSAYKIGLRNGDKIISVDNKEIENFQQIIPYIILNNAKTMQVSRDEQVVNVALPDTLIRYLIKKNEFFTVRIPFIIGDFAKESAGREAGLKKEDKIVGINGQKIIFFDEFRTILQKHKNDTVIVSVLRKGKPIEIYAHVPSTGLLGISPLGDITKFFEIKENKYGFFAAIPAGINKGFNTISNYLKQFKVIFSKKNKGYESVGGFITIGSIFPGEWDWSAFWSLTAFLSIILAVMNILPIPALDGGHVLFVLYEMVTGRKPSDKFLEYAQVAGLIILLAILLYANINDVFKLFK